MPQGEYLQYGGQAIVEGVMMRSPRFFCIACRAPNGQIVLQTEAIEKTWIGRQKWLKKPLLRGSLALLDAMALGSRAMKFATHIQIDPAYLPVDESATATPAAAPAAQGPSKKVQDITVASTMVVAIVFGLVLFNYVPNLIAEYTQRAMGSHDSTRINLVSEIIKMVIFLGYVGLIGLLPDIRRVFQYHGAEHKAINTLEAEQTLNMENCKNQTRLHPRCGTSFAIIVLLLGLLTFTFVPRYPITGGKQGIPIVDVSVRFLIELMILPLIAGVAYELLRFAGKFRNQGLVNLFFKPGIWSQYLTTREPDETQIEVSLAALKSVLRAEEMNGVHPEEEVNALESAPIVVPTNPL
ncbi:DUF1385 domain-containing protein [Fimbriimonas ginsengisoli]|uniref:DUF1385 domain-containing protein n=1 Tax=Fimbriimonas ginsengisoli Gsoil 348 TaxID=661478 RepID=A0A068NU43_FIMGI|nr:DUF1385 domain-containing protein [Fimbriimonas ginsengisoli]AIE86961.1 hypothetical protein OP10G_3593 [Fimbriimonas ginsengisoli Gsoil 348]